jgi:hypothetical protein
MIRIVSITSSQIGSKSQPTAADGEVPTRQDAMIQAVQSAVKSDPNLDPNADDGW